MEGGGDSGSLGNGMGRVEGGKKCGQDVKQLNKLTKKKLTNITIAHP